MELLWNHSEGLTSIDMLQELNEITQSPTYVHRVIKSLLGKNLIRECGSVRYNKQYARKFQATITKEEYAAGLLREKGFCLNSLNGIVSAFVNPDSKHSKKDSQEIIRELKRIITELEKD